MGSVTIIKETTLVDIVPTGDRTLLAAASAERPEAAHFPIATAFSGDRPAEDFPIAMPPPQQKNNNFFFVKRIFFFWFREEKKKQTKKQQHPIQLVFFYSISNPLIFFFTSSLVLLSVSFFFFVSDVRYVTSFFFSPQESPFFEFLC